MSDINKFGKDLVKLMNKYPQMEFGVWINKQNVINDIAEFINNPQINELFYNIQVRIKENE